MKKLLFGLIAVILLAASLQAQDAKAAKRALLSYNIDQSNKAKLKEAVDAIEGEPTGEEAADPGFFNLKGDIYSAVANQVTVVKQTGLGSVEDLPKIDLLA